MYPPFAFDNGDFSCSQKSLRELRGGPSVQPPGGSVSECIAFLRKVQQPQGSPGWNAPAYNLAKVLWLRKEANAAAEAAELLWALIDDKPSASELVTIQMFLLDLLLEIGDSAGIFRLLERCKTPDGRATDIAWSAALAHLLAQEFNPAARRFRRAIAAAVTKAPYVYRMLTGEAYITHDNASGSIPGRVTTRTADGSGTITYDNKAEAEKYSEIFTEHWHRAGRQVVGGTAALREAIRDAGAPAFAAWEAAVGPEPTRPQEGGGDPSTLHMNMSDLGDLSELMAQFGIARPVLMQELGGDKFLKETKVPSFRNPKHVCSHCQAVKKKLWACAKCQHVQYCGAECQKAAWKDHKPLCKAIAMVGSRVQLRNLSTEALNGRVGLVEGVATETARLKVKLDLGGAGEPGRTVAVKKANLVLLNKAAT